MSLQKSAAHPLVGTPLTNARNQLDAAGVTVHEQQVSSVADVPVGAGLRTSPFASRGDALTVYTANGQIVGYARYDPQAEVAALRQELAALQATVAGMQRG